MNTQDITKKFSCKRALSLLLVFSMMLGLMLPLMSVAVYAEDNGETVVNWGYTAEDLAYTLFEGNDIEISNAYKDGSVSYITNANDLVGMDSCIMLDTSGVYSGSTDSDLAKIISSYGNSYGGHTSSLEFTMTATNNMLNFNYVFASREFDQNSSYNDVFALFISCNDGPFENIALLSNGKPVTITNLRAGISGTQMSNGSSTNLANVGYKYDYFTVANQVVIPNGEVCNGISNRFTAQKKVNVGDKITLKFVIADVGDTGYNSYVAIESGSIQFSHVEIGDLLLEGDGENFGAIHVNQQFIDSRIGDNLSLQCKIGDGSIMTLSTIKNETAEKQSLFGDLDMSGYSDGEYTVDFWINNDTNSTRSDVVTRVLRIEDGKITAGLDSAYSKVYVLKDGAISEEMTGAVSLGQNYDASVANGSVLANGEYNVYLYGHAIGTFAVDGGYGEHTVDFAPIHILGSDKPDTYIQVGTSSEDIYLDNIVSIITDQGAYLTAYVNWLHETSQYDTEGVYTVIGMPQYIVGFENFGSIDDMFVFDNHISANIVVEHAHKYVHEVIPATCTSAGVGRDVCYCGSYKNSYYIPALGHSYTSEVTKEATCTEHGVITYSCQTEGCGHTYEVNTYSEHKYEMTVIEPSCTVDGATVYTCVECGDINKITIPAAHKYVSEVTKPATKEEDGEIKYTCTECNDSYTEVIPASNANILVIQDRIPWDVNNIPTLLNDMMSNKYISGWTMTTTANIGNVDLSLFDVILIANDQTTATYNQLKTLDSMISEFVIAGGTVIYGACDHGWSGGDISFDIFGEIQKTDCYSMHNYIVDVTHPIVTGSLTDNKSLTNELLLGTYCSHSGFKIDSLPEGYNVILQDSQGNATLAEYPLGAGRVILSGLTWEFYYSRIYTGTTSYSKNVFDDLIAYAVSPESLCEHKYDEGTVVAPDCETDGYTIHTCSECNSTYKDSFVPALGHEMGEWIVDSEPDCQNSGSQHQVCTHCGETVIAVIPATGHSAGEWIVNFEFECLGGTQYKECTDCGTVLVEGVYIPTAEHTPGEWIVDVPATPTQEGSQHKECTVCGAVLETETVSILAKLVIENVTAEAGNTVNVAIRVEENPGIIGALLTISYDPALELIDAQAGDAWTALNLTAPSVFSGSCSFLWDGVDSDDLSNGTIIVLTFKLPDDAAKDTVYSIEASYEPNNIINSNYEQVVLGIENGSITVTNEIGDINNDGIIDVSDVVVLRRYIAGYGVVIDEEAADIDGDGYVTDADVDALRYCLVNNEPIE